MNDLMSFVNSGVTFVGHILALVGGGFALVGTASAASGLRWTVDVAQMPLSMRVVILLVVAASLGWLLGAVVSWLSGAQSDGRRVACIGSALVGGALLMLTVEWLAASSNNLGLPAMHLFAAAGLAAALWMAMYQFRTHAEAASKGSLAIRAASLFSFAAVAVALTALALIGGA